MTAKRQRLVWTHSVVILILALGCTTNTKPKSPQVTSATIDMPPKELVAQVKRIVEAPPISLPIVSENEGTIETGYQSFKGEWHIARHWQERTKYLIRVAPDWDEPTKRSRLDVTAKTQQRAASNQTFDDAPELDRTNRAADVLKEIEARLPKTPAP